MLQDDRLAPAAGGALEKFLTRRGRVSLGYKRENAGAPFAGRLWISGTSVQSGNGRWAPSEFPSCVSRPRAERTRALTTLVASHGPASTSLAEELRLWVHRAIARTSITCCNPALNRVTPYLKAVPNTNLGPLDRLKTIHGRCRENSGL